MIFLKLYFFDDDFSHCEYLAFGDRLGEEQWWNDADRREPKYSDKNLRECKFVHPQQTPYGLWWYWSKVLRGETPATNNLFHGEAEILDTKNLSSVT
jgi:hypothetical protein